MLKVIRKGLRPQIGKPAHTELLCFPVRHRKVEKINPKDFYYTLVSSELLIRINETIVKIRIQEFVKVRFDLASQSL